MISRPSLAHGAHIRYSTGWRFDSRPSCEKVSSKRNTRSRMATNRV